MIEPEGTGSRQDDEDVVLPSWIDLAIAKSKGPAAAGEPAPASSRMAESEYGDPELDDPADAREIEDPPYARSEYQEPEAVQDADERTAPPALGSPDAARDNEPFPSFLDRRRPLFSETSPEPAATAYSPSEEYAEAEPGSDVAYSPTGDVDRYEGTSPDDVPFDDRRAAIISEALTDLRETPGEEPVPLPVAPVRHRGGPSPWLMAAIFFAAAAGVLAVLIWLRPLPR